MLTSILHYSDFVFLSLKRILTGFFFLNPCTRFNLADSVAGILEVCLVARGLYSHISVYLYYCRSKFNLTVQRRKCMTTYDVHSPE